jgi:hypothetical protein
MAIKMPIIASDTTITSRSILSHSGMRFADWVMGVCPRLPDFLCRNRASGYEPVHTWGLILASAASRNALGPSGVAATDPTLNDRLDDLVFAG